MSCKLLLNLVECIKARSEKETCVNKGRELLMRMNEVFVLKFKTVAKMQLPVLMAKHKQAFQQVKFPKMNFIPLHSAQFFIWMWQLCLSKIVKSKDPIFGLSPLAQLMYFELLIPNLSLVFARIASFCQKMYFFEN